MNLHLNFADQTVYKNITGIRLGDTSGMNYKAPVEVQLDNGVWRQLCVHSEFKAHSSCNTLPKWLLRWGNASKYDDINDTSLTDVILWEDFKYYLYISNINEDQLLSLSDPWLFLNSGSCSSNGRTQLLLHCNKGKVYHRKNRNRGVCQKSN